MTAHPMNEEELREKIIKLSTRRAITNQQDREWLADESIRLILTDREAAIRKAKMDETRYHFRRRAHIVIEADRGKIGEYFMDRVIELEKEEQQ